MLSSIKLGMFARGNQAVTRYHQRFTPTFNLIEVEVQPVGTLASQECGFVRDAFAELIVSSFDLIPCRVAYFVGANQWLREIACDATREAIRDGELRLTGSALSCLRSEGNAHSCVRQMERVAKYVGRGFRLGRLPGAQLRLTAKCTRVVRVVSVLAPFLRVTT